MQIRRVFTGGGGRSRFGARLASLRNTENWANVLFPLGIEKPKSFRELHPIQRALPVDPDGVSSPRSSVIGSLSTLAMRVHPTFLTRRRPWPRVPRAGARTKISKRSCSEYRPYLAAYKSNFETLVYMQIFSLIVFTST